MMKGLGAVALTVCALAGFVSAHLRQTDKAPHELHFDLAQAQADLSELVRGPREIGSPAAAEARAWLVAELEQVGLTPQVERRFVCTTTGACGEATNVVVRLPGETDRAPLVLSAHLDTVASSPGAHDDALGVVVLLGVARSLAAQPQPGRYRPRPVVLLFDDGEEVGLLGARAFAELHPEWAKGAYFFMTVDGMGGPTVLRTQGPADMAFLWTLGQAPTPQASSLERVFDPGGGFDASQVFSALGVPSVTIAGHQGYEVYHTAADDLGVLSRDTIADRGEATLRLVQASFRNRHRHETGGAYGDVFGQVLLYGLPSVWMAAGLAALLLLLAGPLPAVGWRGGGRMLVGLAAVGGARLGLEVLFGDVPMPWSLVCTLALWVAFMGAWRAPGPTSGRGWPGAGMVALGLSLLGLGLSVFLPRAALGPVVAAAAMAVVALGVQCASQLAGRGGAPSPIALTLGLGAAAVVLADQAVSAAALMPEGPGLTAAFGHVVWPLLWGAMLAPVVGELLPGSGRTSARTRWGSTGLAVLLAIGAQALPGAGATAPTSTLQLIDEGTSPQRLVVRGEVLPAYRQTLDFETQAQVYPWSSGNYPQPVARLEAPAGEGPQVQTSSAAQGRLRLMVSSAQPCAQLRLSVAPEAGLRGVWVRGVRVPLSAEATQWSHGWTVVTVHHPGPVEFELEASGPEVRVQAAALSRGLPPALQGLQALRGPGVHPAGFGDSTERSVQRVVSAP